MDACRVAPSEDCCDVVSGWRRCGQCGRPVNVARMQDGMCSCCARTARFADRDETPGHRCRRNVSS